MLSRIAEPELMDTPEEARDYDGMDHAAVNRQFVADLLQTMARYNCAPQPPQLPPGGGWNMIDLGTGTAQIPIELCRQADRIQVMAVDAAAHMLALARHNIAAAGLCSRIQLQQIDAKRLPFADAKFDGVVSNSIVHHVCDPVACLHEAARVTRTGGLLFFRDLLRPNDETELQTLVDRYAPAGGVSPAADHQQAMFADSLRSAFTLEEMRRLVAELGFPSLSVQQTSDRHWTWAATVIRSEGGGRTV